MNSINFYVHSGRLIELLKNIAPPDGLRFNFQSGDNSNADVLITSRLPDELVPGPRYVLCTDTPEDLNSETLGKLYALWPKRLTPSLVRFYFRRLGDALKAEVTSRSENAEYQKRLSEMAHQDYLTGLATRWSLQEYVRDRDEREYLTCVYFDLDNFKKVNDTFGHIAGDRALAATAEMMQQDFGDGFIARMGGDEFMIVLTGERNIGDVELRVNNFMSDLLSYYRSTRTMKVLSISAGISQRLNGTEKNLERLIHESDLALYEAKKNGRACCRVYHPSMERIENHSSPANFFLVDYENVGASGLNGINALEGYNTVCIFYSDNAAQKISLDFNRMLNSSNANIIYRKVEAGSRNALDFQLSSYLGEIITENANNNCKYFIVSKDNGYMSLIPFWAERNVSIELVADLAGTKITSSHDDLAARVAELVNDEAITPAELAKIIMNARTKTEVNNALVKKFKDSARAGVIYKAIKPLITDKKGSNHS